jgi:hypothetical protein
VITQVERRCIDPQRTAETSPRHVEHLTEPREEMQSTFDRLLRGLDPEAAIGIEETAAIENAQGTNVLRPHLVRPQDQLVVRTQPLYRRHLTSMPRFSAPGVGPFGLLNRSMTTN